MKRLSIVLAAAVLGACASSNESMMYKPAHWRGPDWDIAGAASPGTAGDAVTLTVNGKDVAHGLLTARQPQSVLKGSYEGYDVAADCSLMQEKKVGCAVSVGDQAAGKIVF